MWSNHLQLLVLRLIRHEVLQYTMLINIGAGYPWLLFESSMPFVQLITNVPIILKPFN